jgi:hypothetical protein
LKEKIKRKLKVIKEWFVIEYDAKKMWDVEEWSPLDYICSAQCK